MALTIRPIGQNDYSVREDGQDIGRIRYASERTPGVWLWYVQVHITGGLPMGTSNSLDSAKAAFKSAWEAFKKKHSPEEFERAYRAMNIRNDG